MKKIYGILLAGLILAVLTTTASASVTYKTNKLTYNQGDSVKFTLKNNNPYPIEMDIRWPTVSTLTGECVYGCGAHIMNYEATTISAWGSYSWVWNQKNDNGDQVSIGYYRGELNGYKTGLFRIKAQIVRTQ